MKVQVLVTLEVEARCPWDDWSDEVLAGLGEQHLRTALHGGPLYLDSEVRVQVESITRQEAVDNAIVSRVADIARRNGWTPSDIESLTGEDCSGCDVESAIVVAVTRGDDIEWLEEVLSKPKGKP